MGRTFQNPNLGRLAAFGALAVSLATGVVIAQDQGADGRAKPYVPRKIVLSPQPVTRTEAKKVFEKVNIALIKVVPTIKPLKFALSGKEPITRAEVIDQFSKLFETAKPQFKIKPVRGQVDMSGVTVKDPGARAKLETLIAWKCVDGDGPLATNSKETLQVTEFGDSVGLLLARLADLTHTPDPKWSPNPEPTQPG